MICKCRKIKYICADCGRTVNIADINKYIEGLEKIKEAVSCMEFLSEPDEGKYYHVSEEDFERIDKIYRDLKED